MSLTYKNAPLVELVAELRWGLRNKPDSPEQQTVVFALPQSKDEELFMQFGAVFSAMGYGRFERVMPPGFAVPYGNVAIRCRPSDPKEQAPLFQLGHGVFTANALPPYKSWDDFCPVVLSGIKGLFEACERAGTPPPLFSTALIRYIDAFRNDLSAGHDVRTFLSSVMGIEITLPDAILSRTEDPKEIKPNLSLLVPTSVGRLELKFSEGKHGNERVIVMDTSVLIQRDIGPDAEAAIAALSDGRKLIHDLFLSLTAPVHDLMEPIV